MAGFFEIAASHERRSDPLPQGNGGRHRQELFTGQGEEDAPRAALRHLVKTSRCLLERLESRAKQLSRASWTTGAILTDERHAQRHNATTQPAVSGSGSGSDPKGQPTSSTSAGSASGRASVIGSRDHTTTTAVRRDPRPIATRLDHPSQHRNRKGQK